MGPIPAPPVSLAPLLPVVIVLGAAVLVLLLDLLPPRRSKDHLAAVSVAGVVAALVVSVLRWNTDARAFDGMVVLDSTALLYGVWSRYGAPGTTNVGRIATGMAGSAHEPLFLVGMSLVLVGFGFKISLVPFHMWAPDVYEGAPTSVSALIATGSKAAAFAA